VLFFDFFKYVMFMWMFLGILLLGIIPEREREREDWEALAIL
jgi:hypothetical protein